MDNLTHSLVGAYVGMAVSDRFNLTGRQRSTVIATSVFTNNLPDLDLLYAQITPGPLGYLLHHRGHTHTIVFALVPLILLTLILCLNKLRGSRPLPVELISSIFIVTGLGPLIHLALDGLNSYGIHPFWPFNGNWIYGDSLFIVEPVLWLIFALGLYLRAQTQIGKIVLAIIALSAAGLILFSGYLPIFLSVTILAASTFYIVILRKLNQHRILIVTGAISLILISLNLLLSRFVKDQLLALQSKYFSNELINDIVVSPAPANPNCWSFIYITQDADRYIMRRGVYSILGAVDNLCAAQYAVGKLASGIVAFKSDQNLKWLGEFSSSVSEFRELVAKNCKIKSFLRFARAPLFTQSSNIISLSDLRFDRTGIRRSAFSKLEIDQTRGDSDKCPAWLPSWQPIRTELLR